MKKTSMVAIAASVALVGGAIGLFGASNAFAQENTRDPIEFTVEFLPDRDGNTPRRPASASMPAADVIETGIQALEHAFDVNLEGRAVHMMYMPRVEAHSYISSVWEPTEEEIQIILGRFVETGMNEEEALEAIHRRISLSREYADSDPFFVAEMSSYWLGRLFPENTQTDDPNMRISEFDFRINAETGAVASLHFEPAANAAIPSNEERIAFWDALNTNRPEQPENTPALDAEIRELARQAIEELGLLDAEIAEYGQVFLSRHPNVALQLDEQASLTVTCVNGISVELLFTKPQDSDRILTWIQFRGHLDLQNR